MAKKKRPYREREIEMFGREDAPIEKIYPEGYGYRTEPVNMSDWKKGIRTWESSNRNGYWGFQAYRWQDGMVFEVIDASAPYPWQWNSKRMFKDTGTWLAACDERTEDILRRRLEAGKGL